MTCWRIRHVSIFCFHSFCFTLTKLKIKYLEPHTFTLTPPSHNLILTYRLLGLQQISRLCFAVLFSTVYSQTAGCYHVAVFADLSWYMWDWCCVLVAFALQTGTVGIQPKRWLQRCTSAQSSNEATTSKTHKLREVIPLCERIAASWASVVFYRSCCLIVIYPSFGFLLLYSYFSPILFQPVDFDKYVAKWQQTFLNLEVFT